MCLLISCLMTCGNALSRCCRFVRPGAAGIQAGCRRMTVPLCGHRLCVAQGCELAGRSRGASRLQRGNGLAASSGLDRSGSVAPAARGLAGGTAQGRAAGDGRRRDRRLARPGAQRGAHTGPSPVDRARPGSKHHVVVDRQGTPLAVSLTGGNRHDVTQLMPLLDAIPHIHGLRGRPRHRPRRLFADRSYDFDKYRRLIRARGITPKIARRGAPHGSGLGKTRWVVERTFAWLHQFKRLRIRYEIRADLHLRLLQLACSITCLRRLISSF